MVIHCDDFRASGSGAGLALAKWEAEQRMKLGFKGHVRIERDLRFSLQNNLTSGDDMQTFMPVNTEKREPFLLQIATVFMFVVVCVYQLFFYLLTQSLIGNYLVSQDYIFPTLSAVWILVSAGLLLKNHKYAHMICQLSFLLLVGSYCVFLNL